MKICCILLMAGASERFGSPLKQFAPLGKRPLYHWALQTIESSSLFADIILVIPPGHPPIDGYKCVEGGKTRQQSSFLGISACSYDIDAVCIHDAARPFVSGSIFKQHVEKLQKHSAINTCIPTADTINYVEQDTVSYIPDRKHCMLGQTPQSFERLLILQAHQKTKQIAAYDDCSLALEQGHTIHVVKGNLLNFKVTTPLELAFANNYLYSGDLSYLG